MRKNKLFLCLLSSLVISGCQHTSSDIHSDHSDTNSDTTSEISESDSITDTESNVEIVEIESLNETPIRLSSIYDVTLDSGINTYKMEVPYDDTYKLKCNDAKRIEVFNSLGQSIAHTDKETSLKLNKDDIVYVTIEPTKEEFSLFVTPKDHLVELPYEINSSVDLNELETYSNDKSNPLKATQVNYTKRNDGKGLYINCNNPEKITEKEFNTCLTRQDVTDKEVFFTFEHNNANSIPYYYGYRVVNTDDHDIYITVKNLGYQVSGAGAWLGEDEWIKFYNTKFLSDTSNYTSSQLSNFNAYVGFTNQYKSNNRKPITYRIPAGEYIYVMGGTVADAYRNISVFDSANKKVKGSCGNGAVIFEVSGGTAEGLFLVYTDPNAKTINESDYVKGNNQYGYIVTRDNVNVGSQYVGLDECHGVVEADFCWTFNDATPSNFLPVSYTNPYYTTQKTGTIYKKIENFIPQEHKNIRKWTTHINPNHSIYAVGTDMTDYKTVANDTKEEIICGAQYFDGRGKTANIGNWMVDYIDTFTLVNQGDRARTFTYSLKHTGVILAMVRDENGFIDPSYTPKYCVMFHGTEYGDAIDDGFKYSITIEPHSIARFSVNYNLLANSYGNIVHDTYLD